MIRKFLIALLALSLLATGCARVGDLLGVRAEDTAAPRLNGLPLRTDSSLYHVQATGAYRVTIGVTYTNPTAHPVYIASCGGPHPPIIDKWENGEWITAFDPPVPACYTPPVEIGPNQTYAYTYRVLAALPSAAWYPRWEAQAIPGTYRLRWLLRGPHAPLPEALTVSEPFELRLAH